MNVFREPKLTRASDKFCGFMNTSESICYVILMFQSQQHGMQVNFHIPYWLIVLKIHNIDIVLISETNETDRTVVKVPSYLT